MLRKCPSMAPYDWSLNTTATTGTLSRMAVFNSSDVNRKPPSPLSETTGRSGQAICAPIAAGRLKPSVPK